VHDLQFSDDPTAHLLLGLNMDDLANKQSGFVSIWTYATNLSCHNGSRRHVPNLTDSASIPVAKIFQYLQVLPLQIKFVFDSDL
jgi:hypothetical protein